MKKPWGWYSLLSVTNPPELLFLNLLFQKFSKLLSDQSADIYAHTNLNFSSFFPKVNESSDPPTPSRSTNFSLIKSIYLNIITLYESQGFSFWIIYLRSFKFQFSISLGKYLILVCRVVVEEILPKFFAFWFGFNEDLISFWLGLSYDMKMGNILWEKLIYWCFSKLWRDSL